jgi:hypothetical protein
LCDAGECEALAKIVIEQRLLERPTCELTEMIIDVVKMCMEFCVVAVRGEAHSYPLAAIARIHKGNGEFFSNHGACFKLRMFGSRDESFKRGAHFVLSLPGNNQAVLQEISPVRDGAGGAGDLLIGDVRQPFAVILRQHK